MHSYVHNYLYAVIYYIRISVREESTHIFSSLELVSGVVCIAGFTSPTVVAEDNK